MTIRVLLIDDDAFARTAVGTILAANPEIEIVGEGEDGDAAVRLVESTRPDVVIMDLQMRNVGGVEATKRVRALPNPPEVLVMTVWDVEDAVISAIDAGAAGFITKSSAPEDIARAVRSVTAGDAVLSPSITRQVIAALRAKETDQTAQLAKYRVSTLTPRELEVARLVGAGLSNPEIAKQLFISEHTVKPHIAEIGNKLGVTGRVKIAVVLTKAGYVPDIW